MGCTQSAIDITRPTARVTVESPMQPVRRFIGTVSLEGEWREQLVVVSRVRVDAAARLILQGEQQLLCAGSCNQVTGEE